MPHHEVDESYAESGRDGEIHNRLRPLTEGFYDTALNEGQCTDSEVMDSTKFDRWSHSRSIAT